MHVPVKNHPYEYADHYHTDGLGPMLLIYMWSFLSLAL